DPRRVARNAVDRAHLPALGLVEVPDAFGAAKRVDHVDLLAHRDRPVGALGLADVAVDALVGDDQRHRPFLRRAALQAFAAFSARSCASLRSSQRSTGGATNCETSPSSSAISRTSVPEMNWYLSVGVRKIVSTSGIRWRFMPAIWNSYSKSVTARRPRTTTSAFCCLTKFTSRPEKLVTSTFE